MEETEVAFIFADEKIKQFLFNVHYVQFHMMMLKNGVSEHVTIYTLTIAHFLLLHMHASPPSEVWMCVSSYTV